MTNSRLAFRVVVYAALGIAGCGSPSSSQKLGTNSNWFVSCDDDGQCSGSTTCQCTRCTQACDVDADCEGLKGARCSMDGDAAALSQCGSAPASGICLPRCSFGECPSDQACVSGGCVSSVLPENELCAPVALAEEPDRAREDELLDLVQTMRAAGGVTCGSSAASSPASASVRASATLRCAARVLAADMDESGTRSLVDSSGRNTEDRERAAGYVPSLWAESWAIDASSPSDALAVMLGDAASCSGLIRDGYGDAGTAHVGRAYVVTLGAE